MPLGDTATAGPGMNNPEVLRGFVPTPERVSQYLEMRTEDVMTQMASVEGREQLHQSLLEHEADLRKLDPSFDPDILRRQLDIAGDTLQQKERFLQDIQSPEQKGVFRRAWESVAGFAKKHPIVTTALLVAAAASATAAGFYFTGNWELLLNNVGLGKIMGGAEAVEELLPLTPETAPLPGGGLFEIPTPISPHPEIDIPT